MFMNLFKIIILLWCFAKVYSIESISLNECRKTKACFKASNKCTIDSCSFIATWKLTKFKGDMYIEFELVGTLQSTGGYIAVGFSEDNKYGNDGVVACYSNPGNTNSVEFVAGYNSEKSPYKNVIISPGNYDKNLLVTEGNNKYGGSFYSNTKRIHCRFMRLISPTKMADKLKDLKSGNKFHILIMRGKSLTSEGLTNPEPGTILISEEQIDFSSGSFAKVSGSSKINSPLAKVHGIMMIIAWIGFCGIAVMLARYYKDYWGNITLKNEGSWFTVHRMFQSVAFIIIVISIIIIFINVGGYSRLEDWPLKLHPILGLISSILFILNPFIALCRCKKYNDKRPWFNWIHFIVGTISYILAIPTMMLGLRLPGAGLQLSMMNAPQWIIIIFVIFQFIMEIILEIHGCFIHRRNRTKLYIYEREVEEYERALRNETKPLNSAIEPKYPKPSGRGFRLFCLIVYIIVCILVVASLTVIIILF